MLPDSWLPERFRKLKFPVPGSGRLPGGSSTPGNHECFPSQTMQPEASSPKHAASELPKHPVEQDALWVYRMSLYFPDGKMQPVPCSVDKTQGETAIQQTCLCPAHLTQHCWRGPRHLGLPATTAASRAMSHLNYCWTTPTAAAALYLWLPARLKALGLRTPACTAPGWLIAGLMDIPRLSSTNPDRPPTFRSTSAVRAGLLAHPATLLLFSCVSGMSCRVKDLKVGQDVPRQLP